MYAMNEAEVVQSKTSKKDGWRKFSLSFNREHRGIEIRFSSAPLKNSGITEMLGNVSFQYYWPESGKSVTTRFRFYSHASDQSGRQDPRWCIKATPESVQWVRNFAKTYGIDVDLSPLDMAGQFVSASENSEANSPGEDDTASQVVTDPPERPSQWLPVAEIKKMESSKPHQEPVVSVHKSKPDTTAPKSELTPGLFDGLDSLIDQLTSFVESFDEEAQRRQQFLEMIRADIEAKRNLDLGEGWSTWAFKFKIKHVLTVLGFAIAMAKCAEQPAPVEIDPTPAVPVITEPIDQEPAVVAVQPGKLFAASRRVRIK